MTCPNCGASLPEDSAFCHKCGKPVVVNRTTSDTTFPDRSEPAALSTGSATLSTPTTNTPFASPGRQTNSDDDQEYSLWTGGYSTKAMIGTFIGAAALSCVLLICTIAWWAAGFVAVGAIIILWLWLVLLLGYRKLNVHYDLSNQRFVHKTGILRRVTNRIEVIDMDDVAFEQGIVERFFDVGTIKITSSDRSHPQLVLKGIDQVETVAEMLDGARRKERLSRGIHIEAV